ncbi:MAG: hypothetical protein JNJ85_10090 [Candidatus Kapabacteria bacterium]|nr:hypothetical protein [Candidatus Kapabacteria bacterium]MBX7154702.1 hypothetical protein [Bacteroidota bacterium]
MEYVSSRLQYIELRKHSVLQIVLFLFIAVMASYLFFHFVTIPASQWLFKDSFNAKVETEGEDLNPFFKWKVSVEPQKNKKGEVISDEQQDKVYYFDPFLAVFPMMTAFGLACAALGTAVLPQRIGFVRQKIEREVINTLHKCARIEYGEHGEKELVEISDMIVKADLHKMHELEETWNIPFQDINILKAAIEWRESSVIGRVFNVGDGIRLYLRNHFTLQYENPVLGLIYIGAAILIIIIGLRGLQFIPKDKPSLVLFAISLEFILLIVYAITLIYTRHEDTETEPTSDVSAMFMGDTSGDATVQAQKLLRMFVASRKSSQE